MACLAVITLIKDCYKTLKSHGKHFFFTLSGPTGSLNTKVLFKEYIQTFCLCIPTDMELCYRLLLSLHTIIDVSVHPSLLNSWFTQYNESWQNKQKNKEEQTYTLL